MDGGMYGTSIQERAARGVDDGLHIQGGNVAELKEESRDHGNLHRLARMALRHCKLASS
jgi:hypothetical protein